MDEITLIVGTTKGAFLITADAERRDWRLSGPFCDGWPINHAAGDPESGALWVAGGGDWNGAGVWRSLDGGATWTLTKLSNGQFDDWIAENPEEAAQFGMEPSPPAPFTGQITALWSLGRSGDRLYAGAKPAALFASDDGGESWSMVTSLTDHPSRKDWEPGGAGLILHSIVADPAERGKLWVGISAAGVFATDDDARSWDRRNRRSNADAAAQAAAGPHPRHADEDVGLCVHNFVRAPGNGPSGGRDLLYQQNHHGVFRSGDGGRSWEEITTGLPSGFGFPIAVHPRDPETIWVLPLAEDGPLPARRLGGGLALARRWRELDGAAPGPAGARLLLHGAAPVHGHRPGRARRRLLRHQQRLGLRQRRRRRELDGDRPAPAHRALRRGAAPGLSAPPAAPHAKRPRPDPAGGTAPPARADVASYTD